MYFCAGVFAADVDVAEQCVVANPHVAPIYESIQDGYALPMMRDWIKWHQAYDDPHSLLSQRLVVVSQMIRGALDIAPPGEIRVLSLCAGDGRDLILATAGHPRVMDITGLLVELNLQLAQQAATNVTTVNANLRVKNTDAGDTGEFRSALPIDLLLLCGIFGNITNGDIQRTIAAVPAICRSGATVIWTRHRREPDITPKIRGWFDAAGCAPTKFVSPGVGSFAIGCERRMTTTDVTRLPKRLFTFRDNL